MRKLSMQELGRLDTASYKKKTKLPVVVVLDGVRSMNNVGSIFRTCDAFAVTSIYLCGITPQPPHREITKTALGAEKSVDWAYHMSAVTAIKKLKKEGYEVLPLEQTTQRVALQNKQFENNRKYAFVFGNEVKGISDEVLELVDASIEVPQFGTKHSFNIAVCVGIVLWDYVCKSTI